MDLGRLARKLDALGNPTRLALFRTLVRAGETGMSVGALQGRHQLAASTLSHHLAVLLREGLASQKRQGTTLICRADFDTMTDVVTSLQAECCVDEGAAK